MSWHYLSNMVVVLLLISLAWSEVRVEMALALMDFQRIIGVKKILTVVSFAVSVVWHQ